MSSKKDNKLLKKICIEVLVVLFSTLACTKNSGFLGQGLNYTINILFGSFFILVVLNINILVPKFLFFKNKRIKKIIKINFILIQILLISIIADMYYEAGPLTITKEYQNIVSGKLVFHIGVLGNIIFGNIYRLIGEVGFHIASVLISLYIIYINFPHQISKINVDTKSLKKFKPEIKNEKKVVSKKKDIKPEVKIFSKKEKRINYDLLDQITDQSKMYQELERNAKINGENLVAALLSFKLKVEISNVSIGPNITKYELIPEPGVKVSKFLTYSNDIAMALACPSVRIEAPIYGKSAVGIEVSNSKSVMVSLKEVFKSTDINRPLEVALGKDVNGVPVLCDIAKTPHLLVAGATGSGKSVCINTFIASLLLKCSSEELKLILIDPKKVELTPFNDVEHLLTKVVTDPKKAATILQKMVFEMENRYEIFASTNCKNIDSYNDKCHEYSMQKLPYIVIVIDELADLMLVASKEVETSIARLTQMARACGIHLIIATQRPSTDVITGLIKSNIPSRISFAVSSSIDSRTILDKVGAEKLLGRGDMLFSMQGTNELKRIQGCFLSEKELLKIINSVSGSNENECEQFEKEVDEMQNSHAIELDEYYNDAKSDVIHMQKASTSYIQRKYRVGYNRAMNIMQQLEDNNVVEKSQGTKPRKVLMQIDDLESEE